MVRVYRIVLRRGWFFWGACNRYEYADELIYPWMTRVKLDNSLVPII